jgi:predicted amidophosphoribosyltransferase
MQSRLFRKICDECRREFETENRRFFICPECWKEHYQTGERCAAVKDDGLPCCAWAICASHIRQGYGLFELVVKRCREIDR